MSTDRLPRIPFPADAEHKGTEKRHKFALHVADVVIMSISPPLTMEVKASIAKLLALEDNMHLYGDKKTNGADTAADNKMLEAWRTGTRTVFTEKELKHIRAGFDFVKTHRSEFGNQFIEKAREMYSYVFSAPNYLALPTSDLSIPSSGWDPEAYMR